MQNLVIYLIFDTFNQDINKLLQFITHLMVIVFNKSNIYLPLGIKYLKLDCNNPRIIAQLSSNIEVLELNKCFNLELNDLPTSLKKIIFYDFYLYLL